MVTLGKDLKGDRVEGAKYIATHLMVYIEI